MTASPSSPAHASRMPLRMQLAASPAVGHLSGVWWPQSRNLQVEAADLVDHFPDQIGHIDRLLFSRPDWDNSVVDCRGVRRIGARRGLVKVDSFPSDDTHLMILLLASGRRVSLTVIASDSDPLEANGQFRALSDGDTSSAAVETLHGRSDTEEPPWM
jgi:Family of unknown function (DUF5994)